MLFSVPQSITTVAVATSEVLSSIVPTNSFDLLDCAIEYRKIRGKEAETNLIVNVCSIVTVRWQIPMNHHSLLVAKKKFVIVKGVLNDRLNRTRMNETSTAVLHNSEEKKRSDVVL